MSKSTASIGITVSKIRYLSTRKTGRNLSQKSPPNLRYVDHVAEINSSSPCPIIEISYPYPVRDKLFKKLAKKRQRACVVAPFTSSSSLVEGEEVLRVRSEEVRGRRPLGMHSRDAGKKGESSVRTHGENRPLVIY